MNTIAEHPVWAVYDEYRTVRLNMYYYEHQLSSLERNNTILEGVIALSTSSVVVGLWIWGTNIGGIIWKIIATVAAFLSVFKPLVKLPDRIKQRSEILPNWRLLNDEYNKLTISIKERRKYDNEMIDRFHKLLETKTTIVKGEPAEGIDERLRRRCIEKVNRELPPNNFFVPEE
jgi:uncharacterized protein YebE (UPF0316 family)